MSARVLRAVTLDDLGGWAPPDDLPPEACVGESCAPGDGAASELPSDVDPYTDLGNAYRLRAAHGEDLRHCGALGWLVWDGARWAPDATGEVLRRMHDVARALLRRAGEMMAAAAQASSKAERDAAVATADRLATWARRSMARERLDAAVAVAKSLDGIAAKPEDFDRESRLVSCSNGTLDLRTYELRPHRREDMMTQLLPTAYEPGATCPTWDAFLWRIFAGNEGVIRFVQRAAGYSLAGTPTEQIMIVCHGDGANGKSTYLVALRDVFGGELARDTPARTLLARRDDGSSNELAALRGARVVTAQESGEGRRLDEPRVKALTGGDPITCRYLYKEFFTFRPQFVLWLATNHKPAIRGQDLAIWRRIRLVPFGVVIPDAQRDRDLGAKLRAEAPGILRWVVEGHRDWRAHGLDVPPEVEQATAAYQAEQAPLARWISAECIVGPGRAELASNLYDAFGDWCQVNHEHSMTARGFGMALRAAGFRRDQSGGRRRWMGLALADGDEGAAEADRADEQRDPRSSPIDSLWRDFPDSSASSASSASSEPWGEVEV